MRRSTVIYLLLFLGMAGAYYYLNNRPEPVDVTATAEPEAVVEDRFHAEDGMPNSIRVESQTGEVVELVRNAENAWVLTLPIEASAEQGHLKRQRVRSQPSALPTDFPISVQKTLVWTYAYKLSVKFTSGVERIAVVCNVCLPQG